MKQKNKILSDNEELTYIICFLQPRTKNIIYLAYSADIDSICYNSNSILPGTSNYLLAKRYNNVEQAKDDVYKLRYFHREFLKPIAIIKGIPLANFELNNILDSDIHTYKLDEIT